MRYIFPGEKNDTTPKKNAYEKDIVSSNRVFQIEDGT